MKNYVEIAQETLSIIEANEYEFSGEMVTLCDDPQALREVVVYTPEKMAAAVAELEKNNKSRAGEIKVNMLHSFSSAKEEGVGKVLVLNFASAYRPGGGFLRGASAQEEALCRSSSLYASISSEAAAETYAYHRAHGAPTGSDNMLLSPKVAVFRDGMYDLLPEPYNVAVITAAAPNLDGDAEGLEEPQLGDVMRRKIKNLIAIAAQNSYDTLVLGAWGCGVYGHDAEMMSEYFYDVLVNQNHKRYFEKIVFSVYARHESNYNYSRFAAKFKSL